jgi:hypothetical protein
MSCKSSEEIVSDKTLHLFSIVCASFELQFQTNKQTDKKNTYFFMVEFNLFLELYGTDYLLLKSKYLMVNVICQFLRYLM